MVTYGVVRATQDLDLLVVAPRIRLPEVFSLIRSHGFSGDDAELLEALRDRKVARLSGDPLDVEILVPALPYHTTLLERAVLRDVAGRRVPFVSLEDLLVLKLLWLRAKDVPDIHALLAAADASLDTDYLRATLRTILPDTDSRHSELDDLIRRFWRFSP